MEEHKIYLYPCGAPSSCTCSATLTEEGEIIVSDLGQCPYTLDAHGAAIKRAREILERVKRDSPKE